MVESPTRSYRKTIPLVPIILLAAPLFAIVAAAWSASQPQTDQPQSNSTNITIPESQMKPNRRIDDCTTSGCHADILKHKVMHAPTAQLKCLDCHDYQSVDDHIFTLTKPTTQLCESCHTIKLNQVVHTPVMKGDCMGCHDPHGSDHKLILKKDPTKGLCQSCHNNDYMDKKFVHGPVAVGACIVCHQPHSSNQKNLLIDEPSKLCLSCHDEFDQKKKGIWMTHKPMEDGCTKCHDPHASDHPHQLHEAVPKLCFNCHKDIDELAKKSKVRHGPIDEEGGCVQCHSPHFSSLKYLQKKVQPDLCLKCHDKEMKSTDGRTLQNMAALLKDNPDWHGPIKTGSCVACHQPHAGNRMNMLFKAYPPEFYAPFSIDRYALCFSCHLPDMVTEKNGIGLSKFRNGDKNLHFVHVNQEKGRTCRACHEVHASKRPDHIRESVPYGNSGWMLDIGFKKLKDGGSCAPGCHKPRSYDRNAEMVAGPKP